MIPEVNATIWNNTSLRDIEIKENAVELLEAALRHKKKEMYDRHGVHDRPLYSAGDGTWKCQKGDKSLIYEYGHGFTVITKVQPYSEGHRSAEENK